MTTSKGTVEPLQTEVTDVNVINENNEAAAQEPETASDNPVDEMSQAESADARRTAEQKIEGLNSEALLQYMEKIVESEPVQEIRHEVEAIKISFYKQLHAIQDAARKAFAEEHADEEYVQKPSEDENRFKELYRKYRIKRDAFIADTDRIKEENLKKKLAIIEELKELVESKETLNLTFNRFRDLQAKWKEAGQVPQQNMKDIWETYNLHVERFYDNVKINKELRDLDLKKNLEIKTLLCEEAEKLSSEESVIEAFHHLQKLHDQWRETGPVAIEFKEPLWERFKAASSVVNKRHQEHFESIKADQTENLQRKEHLCELVEAIADSAERTTLKAWNHANEKIQELQAEWRTIGFAPKKDNQHVYDRFRAACTKFYEEKRKFYSGVKDDMEQNLKLKEQLCEAVEKLQESEEWKDATDQILELQKKWKEIGAVSRRQSDVVWKRFRAACDRFFERKGEHFSAQETEYSGNLERKESLLAEMEAASVKAGGFDVIKEFQRRWNEIGFVPIRQKDALQKRYKEQLDRLFAQMRASGEGSVARFKEKVAGMKQGGESRMRAEREKLYNKVRQLEQEIAQQENNILFFAKSKGADALIATVRDRIARARQEMADAVEKVRIIDSQDAKKNE